MKLIETHEIGDVTASLYLESLGYTYKIRAYIHGHKAKQVVARSCVYFAKKETAREQMLNDLEQVTMQASLFNYLRGE